MDNQSPSTGAGPAAQEPRGTGDAFSRAGATAQSTADTVQQTASHAFDQMRETGKHQLAGQKNQVAGTIDQVAHAMRQTGFQLRSDDQDTAAQLIDGAASQLEQFSSGLREKDLEQLMRDAESFARRQPALFIGGAFMLGLFAARFLKSGQPADSETMGGYGGRTGMRMGRDDAGSSRRMVRGETAPSARSWETSDAWSPEPVGSPRRPTGS